MKLGISDQPVPIEVCESEREPWEALDDSHVQIRFIESGEENLCGVVPRSSMSMQVEKAWISEGSELASQQIVGGGGPIQLVL
ncbi:MAG: hypothetical protein ACYC92_04440 [Candidatus Acidiferrales bacterium]